MITARPIIIRGAMVTASSVAYPDTDETEWSAASVAYAVGNTVSYLISDLYHKFECIQAHTSAADKAPEAFPDDETNGYWLDLGAVNKFAPFQLDRNTQNDAASPYSVSVDPGERFSDIGIGNIIADEVTLEVYDETPTLVRTETKQLLVRDVYSWYDWLYQPHRQIKKTIFTNLPSVSTHTFKLIFTRTAGNVRVGHIIPGVGFHIGDAEYKAKVKRENFSSFARTFDGEVKIKRRRNVPSNQIRLSQDKGLVDGIKNLIDDLNGEVTFWAGLVETTDGYFESLFTIGLYKDYSYSLDYPTEAIADIEIQEL